MNDVPCMFGNPNCPAFATGHCCVPDDSNFPPDPFPLALAAVFAVAALVIGVVVAAGMWFGLAR